MFHSSSLPFSLCPQAGITSSPGVFSLASVLGDPVRIRSWVIAGLPNDAFSIDNAIMATTARRWPLCIDPQKQANKWIRALEEPRGLKVLKPTEGGDYMRSVEAAVEFGLPVLLENVGEGVAWHLYRVGGGLGGRHICARDGPAITKVANA